MEDIQRPLVTPDVEVEAVAALAVVDGDDDAVVRLAPQQADVDAVGQAAVELDQVCMHVDLPSEVVWWCEHTPTARDPRHPGEAADR
jgi:hypothetical protein